jgi:dTDP-L-rhamnose 4-epimerase
MYNILITGGAGFIGSNLTVKLAKMGHNVSVFDNLSPQVHSNDPDRSPSYLKIVGSCKFVNGDVRNIDEFENAMKCIDVVVHLAAETGTGQSMYDIVRYVTANSVGTANLLEILVNRKNRVQKVVVASSRAIYGEGKYHCNDHGVVYPDVRKITEMQRGDFDCKCPFCNKIVIAKPTDESSKIHPTSIYGITKQNQEQMVMSVCNSMGLQAVAYRYQNVYGPGQSLSNPYTGILSIFSNLILNGKDINIFEDGKESRDFVFIDDVVDATIAGIESRQADNPVFNVGTGINTSVNEVVNELISNYCKDVNYKITGGFRLGDIRHNFADISKANEMLNFEPKFSFQEGIRQFTTWVQKLNFETTSSKYIDSIEEMKDKGLYYGK